MVRTERIYAGTSAMLVYALLCLLLVLPGCRLRLGDEILLPEGYKGWVLIEYGVPGEPALRLSHWKRLIRVPQSGIIKTSSKRTIGYGIDKYYFVESDPRREIPSTDNSCSSNNVCVLKIEYYSSPSETTAFLVGVKSEIDKYPMPKIPNSETKP